MSETGVVKRADATHVDFHLLVETIVHDQCVSHPYARRLHPVGTTHVRSQLRGIVWTRCVRVSRSVMEATDIRVKEVTLDGWPP